MGVISKSARRHRHKSPIRPRSVIVAAVAAFTIIFLCLLIFASGSTFTGNDLLYSPIRWAGGLSVIFMATDLVCFIIGVRDFSENQYHTLFRVLAILLPAAGVALYILVYCTGIIAG